MTTASQVLGQCGHRLFFLLETIPRFVGHQSHAPAQRGEPPVRIIVAQQQAIFRPRSKHAVRLVDTFGNQIVDEDTDVSLAAIEDEGRLVLDFQSGVDAGHQPLGGRLFIAGRAVNLTGEVETLHQFCLQRWMKLRGRGIIVLHRITPAQHLGLLESRNVLEHGLLHVVGQARADPVAVILQRVAAFRLQKNLMPVFVRKADDLVFDGGAIARSAALDLAGVHRCPVQIGPDQVVDGFICIRDVAIELGLGDRLGGKTEGPRVGIAGLDFQLGKVDGSAVESAWRAGLEAGQLTIDRPRDLRASSLRPCA